MEYETVGTRTNNNIGLVAKKKSENDPQSKEEEEEEEEIYQDMDGLRGDCVSSGQSKKVTYINYTSRDVIDEEENPYVIMTSALDDENEQEDLYDTIPSIINRLNTMPSLSKNVDEKIETRRRRYTTDAVFRPRIENILHRELPPCPPPPVPTYAHETDKDNKFYEIVDNDSDLYETIEHVKNSSLSSPVDNDCAFYEPILCNENLRNLSEEERYLSLIEIQDERQLTKVCERKPTGKRVRGMHRWSDSVLPITTNGNNNLPTTILEMFRSLTKDERDHRLQNIHRTSRRRSTSILRATRSNEDSKACKNDLNNNNNSIREEIENYEQTTTKTKNLIRELSLEDKNDNKSFTKGRKTSNSDCENEIKTFSFGPLSL
ncbi:uncharacterized protein [Clytia hemisphaerica]|uniref:Uncharacterized protein n=1 Tax=Clytia hemisphaerica TaxID=252671 RepID=A0A7M5VFI5_9CNID